MHIAILTGQYPTISETFVQQDIDNLRALGHEVTVATLRPGESNDASGRNAMADVVVYPKAGLAGLVVTGLQHPLLTARGKWLATRLLMTPDSGTRWADRIKLPAQGAAAAVLAHALRSRGVEHLHCHFAHAPTTVGMIAARLADIPFSFTGHANDLFQRRVLLTAKLQRAAFVACISEWHRDHYRSIVERPDSAYPIVRCGVDLARFEPTTESDGAATGLRIITIARLIEKKGIDTLIRAVAELPASVDWQLQIAGDGPQRRTLEALAAELALTDRVRFLGPVAHADVPALLRQANVFALPCRVDAQGDRDGIPVAMMEAMAAGLAVVSGDLPAIHELVEDEVSGLFVDGNDPANVAAQLQRLHDDVDLRIELARTGRERVAQEFSATVNRQRLEAAILQSRP